MAKCPLSWLQRAHAPALPLRRKSLGVAWNRNQEIHFNKLIEIFRCTVNLSSKYNKDRNPAAVLQPRFYGGNIEGVKPASVLYFKRDLDHPFSARLEITTLCIIPNRPLRW